MPYHGALFAPIAHWTLYHANTDNDITEGKAPIRWTETGRIQLAMKHNAGSVTAGDFNIYIQMESADATFTIMPSVTQSAICAVARVLLPIDLGAPCWYKIGLMGLAGVQPGPNFDLYTRDCHV